VRKILGPMKLKMKETILLEQRPFAFANFREFGVGSKKYQMKDGTFRNSISKLRKIGEVELAFKACLLYSANKKIQQDYDTRPYGW
jgi:hypothetical protein